METLRSPGSSSRNEYSYQEEGDPNRFTLADYDYDRDEEPSEPVVGPSSAPYITGGPTASVASVVHGRHREPHHHRQSPPRSGSGSVTSPSGGSTTLDKGKTRARALPDLPHPHVIATPVDPRAIGPLRLHSHDNAPPPPPPPAPAPASPPRLVTPLDKSPVPSQSETVCPLGSPKSVTMMEPEMLGSTPLHPLPSLPHSFEIGRLDDEEHGGNGEENEDGQRNGYGYGYGNANEGDRGHDTVSVLEKGSSKFADAVPLPPERATTWWGKILPSSLACRLLLLTVILESCINLTIEGNILWRFNQELESNSAFSADNSRKLPVYLVIFGLAHLWQLVLTFVAIRTKNTVQVTAVTAFNFAFLGYAVVEIYELRTILGGNLATSLPGDGTHSTLLTLPLNILTAVIIAVIAACSVILVVLAFLLRREFGWKRYKFLGADLRIRKYYLRFQVFECICYFSAFFCAGFGIQFIWLVLQKTDAEYIVTWIMFPMSIFVLVIGRFAAKYENRPFMIFFTVGLILGIAYFMYKLVRIWQQASTVYLSVSKSLTLFDILSILSLIGCIAWGALVWRDFGKGLKGAVLSNPNGSLTTRLGLRRTKSETEEVAESELSVVHKRLSID